MGLVISGRLLTPHDPSSPLSGAVAVYVPAARLIVSAPGFALAVLMAAIKHVTSPAEQLNSAAAALCSSKKGMRSPSATLRLTLFIVNPFVSRKSGGVLMVRVLQGDRRRT